MSYTQKLEVINMYLNCIPEPIRNKKKRSKYKLKNFKYLLGSKCLGIEGYGLTRNRSVPDLRIQMPIPTLFIICYVNFIRVIFFKLVKRKM